MKQGVRHVMTVTVVFEEGRGYVMTQRLRREYGLQQSGIGWLAVTLDNVAVCVRQQADLMVEMEQARSEHETKEQATIAFKALASTT